MKLLEFQRGDIIFSYEDGEVDHSLIWVGGDKPIIDSVEGKKISGVIRKN